MNIQRLRNLTTGILHTKMEDIYKDMGYITGSPLLTHMIPDVSDAIKPWLEENVKDDRFWDGKWDATHTGEYPLRKPTKAERAMMLERYKKLRTPL